MVKPFMKKPKNKIGCSDWHLGWGIGYTLLGKLEIAIVDGAPINFIWRGSSQGRHGQKHWSGGMCRYMVLDDQILITDSKHTSRGPERKEVLKAMNALLRMNGLPEINEDMPININHDTV